MEDGEASSQAASGSEAAPPSDKSTVSTSPVLRHAASSRESSQPKRAKPTISLPKDLRGDEEAKQLAFQLGHLKELKEIATVPSEERQVVDDTIQYITRTRSQLLLRGPGEEGEDFSLEESLQGLLDESLNKLAEVGRRFAEKERQWSQFLLHKDAELLFVKKRESLYVQRLRAQIDQLSSALRQRGDEISFHREEYERLKYYIDLDKVETVGRPNPTFTKRLTGPELEDEAKAFAKFNTTIGFEPGSGTGLMSPTASKPEDLQKFLDSLNKDILRQQATAANTLNQKEGSVMSAQADLMSKRLEFMQKRILTLQNERSNPGPGAIGGSGTLEVEPTFAISLQHMANNARESVTFLRGELDNLKKIARETISGMSKELNEQVYAFKLEAMGLIEDTHEQADARVLESLKRQARQERLAECDITELTKIVGTVSEAVREAEEAANLPNTAVEILDSDVTANSEQSPSPHWIDMRKGCVILQTIGSSSIPALTKWIVSERRRSRKLEDRHKATLDKAQGLDATTSIEVRNMEEEKSKLSSELHDMRMRAFVQKMKRRRSLVAQDESEEAAVDAVQVFDGFIRQLALADAKAAEGDLSRLLKAIQTILKSNPRSKWRKALKKMVVVNSTTVQVKPQAVRSTKATDFAKVSAREKSERALGMNTIHCYACGHGPIKNSDRCPRCNVFISIKALRIMMKGKYEDSDSSEDQEEMKAMLGTYLTQQKESRAKSRKMSDPDMRKTFSNPHFPRGAGLDASSNTSELGTGAQTARPSTQGGAHHRRRSRTPPGTSRNPRATSPPPALAKLPARESGAPPAAAPGESPGRKRARFRPNEEPVSDSELADDETPASPPSQQQPQRQPRPPPRGGGGGGGGGGATTQSPPSSSSSVPPIPIASPRQPASGRGREGSVDGFSSASAVPTLPPAIGPKVGQTVPAKKHKSLAELEQLELTPSGVSARVAVTTVQHPVGHLNRFESSASLAGAPLRNLARSFSMQVAPKRVSVPQNPPFPMEAAPTHRAGDRTPSPPPSAAPAPPPPPVGATPQSATPPSGPRSHSNRGSTPSSGQREPVAQSPPPAHAAQYDSDSSGSSGSSGPATAM